MATLQTTTNIPSLTLLLPEDALGDPEVRGAWEGLMCRAHVLNWVFASPTLYEHQARIAPSPDNRVAVLRDANGTIVGICPIVRWRTMLTLQVRKHVFGKIAVEAATILNGEPLIPADPALFRLLVDGLFEGLPWCDCIRMGSIPVESFTCKTIYTNEHKRPGYLIYPRRVESREWVYLELGKSFEAFLESKQSRQRNSMKRRVKKLREHGAGSIECLRVETEDQVDSFYESAFSVAEKSWQHKNLGRCVEETTLYRNNLQNLARLGALRAYLLKCGGRPCAFAIGYQYQDILQIEQSAYSQDFSDFAPGTVLFYLMLEDLYRYRTPRFLNHGTGVSQHKRHFSNRETVDTAVYLFRPTVRNRFRSAILALFYSTLGFARRYMAKRRSPRGEPEDAK
jgi:hypothetical protein